MDENITVSPCFTCEHAIFDERWGEYKCRHSEKYIYDAFKKTECEDYKKLKEKKK